MPIDSFTDLLKRSSDTTGELNSAHHCGHFYNTAIRILAQLSAIDISVVDRSNLGTSCSISYDDHFVAPVGLYMPIDSFTDLIIRACILTSLVSLSQEGPIIAQELYVCISRQSVDYPLVGYLGANNYVSIMMITNIR